MGLVAATTFGLVVWIVLWALGIKSIDGFLLTLLVVIVAIAVRIIVPQLPGNRESPNRGE